MERIDDRPIKLSFRIFPRARSLFGVEPQPFFRLNPSLRFNGDTFKRSRSIEKSETFQDESSKRQESKLQGTSKIQMPNTKDLTSRPGVGSLRIGVCLALGAWGLEVHYVENEQFRSWRVEQPNHYEQAGDTQLLPSRGVL